MVTKVCFVGEGFTRKPPKYERFIRPMVGRCFSLSTKCRYIRTPYSCIKFVLLMDCTTCTVRSQSDSHLTFDYTLLITSYPMVACYIPLSPSLWLSSSQHSCHCITLTSHSSPPLTQPPLLSVPVGPQVQEGPCHSPWAQGHFLPTPYWSQKEPSVSFVYTAGGHNKGHSHWSEHQWTRTGHTRGKGGVGWVAN